MSRREDHYDSEGRHTGYTIIRDTSYSPSDDDYSSEPSEPLTEAQLKAIEAAERIADVARFAALTVLFTPFIALLLMISLGLLLDLLRLPLRLVTGYSLPHLYETWVFTFPGFLLAVPFALGMFLLIPFANIRHRRRYVISAFAIYSVLAVNLDPWAVGLW